MGLCMRPGKLHGALMQGQGLLPSNRQRRRFLSAMNFHSSRPFSTGPVCRAGAKMLSFLPQVTAQPWSGTGALHSGVASPMGSWLTSGWLPLAGEKWGTSICEGGGTAQGSPAVPGGPPTPDMAKRESSLHPAFLTPHWQHGKDTPCEKIHYPKAVSGLVWK